MSTLPESLRVGISSIDEEHESLMAHLNRLLHSPKEVLDLMEFAEMLSRLNSQLIDHFISEEHFMRTTGVPEVQLVRHIDAHNQVIEQITQLSFDLMNRKNIGREDVITKVRSWIVDHLTEHDLGLRMYAASATS